MSRVIDAVLRLKDEFTKPMGKSLDMMTQASKQGERTRKAIDKFGKGVTDVGKSLTAAFTLPVIGMGTAAVKTAASFEQGMAQVQATKGITADAMESLNGETVNAMDALSDLAKEMGKTTKFSANEAAAAINNLAMAGYDVQKTYDTLPTVLSLASAGGLELDYATQLVANGMAVMGESAGTAQRMADMMAVTASNAYGSVADFGEGLLVAGGQAAVCGQSIEDTYTALGILGDAGIQGSEGGTALRNVMKNLYQPTDKAAKTLRKLGIKTSDSEGNLLSMQDVLQQVNGAMSEMNDAEISTTMAEIFDTRTIAAASALLGNADERWDSLRETISGASDMYDGQGAAAGMAATQLDTLEGRVTILKSSLEGLAISFGELLLPFVEKATSKLQELADKFNALTPEQKEQIIKYAAMAAALGPLLIGFGKLISLGSTLFGAMSKVRGAFTAVSKAGGIFKALLGAFSSPIAIVIAAIAGLIAIIAVVATHFDMFKEAASQAMTTIQPHIQALMEKFQLLQATAEPVITFIGDLLANVLVGAFEGMLSAVAPIMDVVTLIIEGLTDVITDVVTFVMAIAEGDWKKAFSGLQTVVEGIMKTITGAIEAVTGVIGGVVGAIGGAITKLKEFLHLNGEAESSGSYSNVAGNATGTPHWKGGWTWVGEKGPELMNLPKGTKILPHEASINDMGSIQPFAPMATLSSSGSVTPVSSTSVPNRESNITITIPKLADQIVIREDADIERIGQSIAQSIVRAGHNRSGWSFAESMA